MKRTSKNKRRKLLKTRLKDTPPAPALQHEQEQHEPLLVSIETATRMLSICQNGVYKLMRSGQLKALKCGRRTVIPVASLREYAASLPARGPAGPFEMKSWLKLKLDAAQQVNNQ
jgi:hypothetical protein